MSLEFERLVITMLRMIIRILYVKQFGGINMNYIQSTITMANEFLEDD